MPDFTTIPAAPGTMLLKAYIVVNEDDAAPGIEEYAVIAWQVPNSKREKTVAILLGAPDEIIDSDEWVIEENEYAFAKAIQLIDGSVFLNRGVMKRVEFIELAHEVLVDRRDRCLAELRNAEV